MTLPDRVDVRQRAWLIAIGGLSLLLPVLLALTVLPTAMSDTRETIAWGRAWPMVTPKHPPLMTWIGALSDMALGPSAAASILVNQLLLAIGIAYLYATLTAMMPRAAAALIAFLFATSLYLVGAPLSYALNADILQITPWLAVVYHFLKAARSDRILHWLAFGVWSAAAILLKYNAAVLFLGMLVAILWLGEFRRLLRNPKLWLAVVVGAALLVPHAVALLKHSEPVRYAGGLLREPFGLVTLDSIAGLVAGYVLFLLPGWLFLVIGWRRKELSFRYPGPADGVAAPQALRFVVVTNIAVLAVLAILILFGGLHYLYRFDAPYLALAVLALGPLVAFDGPSFPGVCRRIVAAAGMVNLALFAGAAVMYLFLTSHDRMQEPTTAAARAILADWHARYGCGPRYFIGEPPSVYGIADVASPDAIGLISLIVPIVPWFDRQALDDEGAVILYRRPVDLGEVRAAIPAARLTDEKELTLPLLRTMTGHTITYHYCFVPPQHCPAAPG
jgi:4-amino-4-deoxy-L-arabinose transferase-like glycosyltransferase